MDNVYLKINTAYNAKRDNAQSIHESAKDILQSQCAKTAEVLHSNERYEAAIKSKMDKKHDEITNIVYKLGNENLKATNDKGMDMENSIERTAKETAIAVERNSKYERDLLRDQEFENQRLLNDHNNMSMDEHKHSLIDIVELENAVELGAVEDTGELRIDIAKNEGETTLNASDNAEKLSLEELQYKQKVELEAFKNKAAFSAEAEDCCCELEERTVTKERETRTLASEIDVRRMRDELALANTENLLLRFM